MIRGIYTAVSGLITQEAKQNVITSNIANANTVGYKSDNLATKKFDDVLIQSYNKISGGQTVRTTIGGLSYGSKIDETMTDFTQGLLQGTDNDTDFGLDGKGFFTVRRFEKDGSEKNYYTRDGQFSVNSQGVLINSSGDKVIGRNVETNRQEPIIVGNKKITVDGKNGVYLDGKATYALDIVDFEDSKSLRKSGDNLYSGENPLQSNAVVKQRSLEKSNVNITNEIVNMMTVMRTFESNQKVIQSIDETLSKAVNEVGTVR